jgi:hypothetical protein
VARDLEHAENAAHEGRVGPEGASEFEKLADVTYQKVTDVFDYLRGSSATRAAKKLDELRDKAHEEALDLETRRQSLVDEVEKSWLSFAQSVDRLKRFESELLGK